MITHVSVFLYTDVETPPFVAIERDRQYKFYDLTRASTYRLVCACRSLAGKFRVSCQGWDWIRAGK